MTRRWLMGAAGALEVSLWGAAAIYPTLIVGSLLGWLMLVAPALPLAGAIFGAIWGAIRAEHTWQYRATRIAASLAAAAISLLLLRLALP